MLADPDQRCCNPEHLDDIVRLAPRFAVFSPNLLELQSILSISPEPHASSQEAEDAAQAFHDLVHVRGAPSRPTIIVRAGSLGAYTISDSWTGWTPAFWTAAEQSQVVDPTGGGNGFMGGLMAGLLLTGGDMRAGQSAPRSWTEAHGRSNGLCLGRRVFYHTTARHPGARADTHRGAMERRQFMAASTRAGRPHAQA